MNKRKEMKSESIYIAELVEAINKLIQEGWRLSSVDYDDDHDQVGYYILNYTH